MLYSALLHEDCLYLSFHAEQVYQNFSFYGDGDYTLDSNLGYFCTELKIDTIERIKNEFALVDTGIIKRIIIDCGNITESRNPKSEFDGLIQYVINKKIALSIIRVGVKLYGDLNLKQYIQEFNTIASEQNEKEYTDFFINQANFNTKNFDEFIFELFQKDFISRVRDKYLEPNPKKVSNSSNVYLPRYINLKPFIEDREFSYFGLYLLCKKAINESIIPKLNKRDTPRKTILFFQSLNGAYLASIFSKLALIDMAYIDHVGPINKIYRTILKNNFEFQNNYLIMSDVICMGTEEKIVKSLIEYENSFVIGNLAIVKIEPITGKTIKEKACSLFILSKENNELIGYKINTDFE